MFTVRHGLVRLVWLMTGILCVLAQGAVAVQHTVKEGDTLTALSRKYGVSVSEIKAANGLDGDNILLGKALKIPKPVGTTQPAPGTGNGPVQVRRAQPVDPKQLPGRKSTTGGGAYTVQPGDSLSKLAVRYGTTVAAIKAANGLEGEGINAGQSLVIPEKGKAPKAAPEPKRAEAPKPPPARNTEPPVQASPASAGGTEHYVLEGDRLSLLAKRYGVSVEVIRQANRLEGDLIRVGQLLVIPVRGTQANAIPPAAGTATTTTAPRPAAMDQGAARDMLARATPGASRPVANVPVWERPEHYLDLVNLGDPTGGAPPGDLPEPPVMAQPSETAISEPAPAAPRRSHVVEEGDSLWKIARQYKVSVDQIQKANGIADDGIQIGQKLVLP